MLEVCFNDSVKAALVLAQDCKRSTIGIAVGVITDKKGLLSFLEKRKAIRQYKKRQMELQKAAVPLGGRREDVTGLSFGLSEGDICETIREGDCPRKAYIKETFSFDRYAEGENMEADIDEFWANCVRDLRKLQSNPASIRVWTDQTPDAQCGLLHIADLLRNSETEIHTVELPSRVTREDNVTVEYRGWGEVAPELFGTFLEREKVLTKTEITALSDRWQRLKTENAPLRVVENGAVVSADISYYDDLIRREFPETSCTVAQIVGGALGRQKVPTGDVFVAKRIQYFLKNGELTATDESTGGFYRTVVRWAV